MSCDTTHIQSIVFAGLLQGFNERLPLRRVPFTLEGQQSPNEVTLAVGRSKLSMEANPIDVHRATDAALVQLGIGI
jgi:hypothetical protein